MKFTVSREAFLKPLQAVIGVVERRQTLPVLANLLIIANKDGLEITATDLEVELVAKAAVNIDEPGEITVPGRKLVDICRTLSEGSDITFALDQDRVQIRSGKSRFTLSTLPSTEFPNLENFEENQKFKLTQTELKQLIEATNFAMAQQDVRYYLNGLMLELSANNLRAVATDGHRLSMCDRAADTGAKAVQQVIVPRKGIGELLRLLEDGDDEAEISIGKNHIRVSLSELQFTSKLIDGKFPDYQKVLPAKGPIKLAADRLLLKQAFARTSILSNEKYKGIRLHLEPNQIVITAHNPEQEEAEEEFPIDYSGDELDIGFNVTYLLDVLGVIDTDRVVFTLNDNNSSCLITPEGDESRRYVVMPMRL